MGWVDDTENPVVTLLARHGRPHAGDLVLGLFARGLGRVPDQLPQLLIGIAIDAVFLETAAYRLPLVPQGVIPDTGRGQFFLTVALLGVCYASAAGLNYVSTVATGRFSMEFQHSVRTAAFDAAQRLEMGYFDDRGTGDVMSVLNDDVRQLQSFVYGVLDRVVNFGVVLVVAFSILLWLNWQLAVTLLVVPAILAAISNWFSGVMEEKRLAIRERVGELNSRLNTNVGGIHVIKSFNTEDHEVERVRSASAAHRDAQWDAHRVRVSTEPAMRTVTNLSSSIVLLLGGYWVLFGPPLFYSGSMTPGALYTFLTIVWAFVTPMENLTGVIDSYQNSKAAAVRIVEVLDEPAREQQGGESLVDPTGEVEYDGVTFSYESRSDSDADEVAPQPDPTIDRVSLHADPGETVGVVGPTGAGKSTLCKLLFRFYDPQSGTVAIDGRDVRDCSVASVREAVGYVSQEPFLFHGTVRENIAYARPGADQSTVVEAARFAGAHEFVTNLQDGYDTVVGDRGVKLSGGQRQRVAIARAVFRDPAILVFDEATSHVDNETEALIQHAMEAAAADRTAFVVAHRLSTVRDADRILVVDDGEIVERGTHEELLDVDGLYADLWRIQVGEIEALPDAFVERVRGGDAE